MQTLHRSWSFRLQGRSGTAADPSWWSPWHREPWPPDQFPAAAALHRTHADNGLRFAILQPSAANRCNQALEIGTRLGLFAGKLTGRDRVARLTEGHNFAFEVSG